MNFITAKYFLFQLVILFLTVTTVFLINQPLFAQNSVIKGTIKNGTTGKPAKVEKLALIGLETGMNILKEMKDVDAAFTLTGLMPSKTRPNLVQVEYIGVKYNTDVGIPSGNDTVAVEILVYEPTEELMDIFIKEAQYRFIMSGTILQIQKIFVLENDSETPRTYINENGTFKFYSPEESHGFDFITVSTGFVPVNQEAFETEEKGVFAIDYPIRPGMTQVGISYHVGYTNKMYAFSEKMLYDMNNFVVITSPADIMVTGGGLIPSGGTANSGFGIFSRDYLARGENLSFTLTGGTPAPSSGGNVISVPEMGSGYIILFIILIVAILGLSTIVSRNKAPVKENKKKGIPEKLIKRKEELITKIAALDDKYTENKIIESDYHRQRALLRNKLVEVYKKTERET